MRTSLLAALLFVLSLPAGGQNLKRFEVSVFGGYLYGGTVSDNRFPDITSPTGELIQDRGHVQFDNAPTYGFRVDYRLSRWLLLEAQASTASNSLVFSRPPFTPPNGRAHGFRTDSYMGGLVLEWPGRQIRPFAVIGVGATHFDPREDPEDQIDETRFTGNLGVGIKAFLSDHWGLRIDARGYATSVKGNGGFGFYCFTNQIAPGGQITPVPCERRDWLTNGELSGGIVFAF
jgi:hypothetical protein